MNKLKSTMKEIQTDLSATVLRIASGDFSVITKSDRILIVIMTFLMFVFYAACVTCSAEGNIFDTVKETFGTYYKNLVSLATVIAATCIIGGLLWTMLSPSSKASATPIGWIKKVLFCYFLILVLGGIIGLVRDVAGDYLNWSPSDID